MSAKLCKLTFLLGDIHDVLFGVCSCVRACVSFQHHNNVTEFHETWYECHVTEGHRNAVRFNYLQPIITTRRKNDA